MSSLDGIGVAYAALVNTPTPGWNIRTMLMIAGAESSWRHLATNHNRNGSTDFGMWQINNAAWPQLFNQFRWDSPQGNAGMASAVYQKQGIHAWVTFNTNAVQRYASYVDDFLASHPSGNVPTTGPVGGPPSGPGTGTDFSPDIRNTAARATAHAQRMSGYYWRLRGL
ncbi:MAG: hypothetical protein ACRDUW_10910 [Pseudonocardiaceae bacterium]